MIHELNHLNEKQILNNLNQNQIAEEGVIQNKEILLALSKIQMGDILTGKMILENNQTMLKLESGLKLLAHIETPILSDQVLNFLVLGKEGQHLELQKLESLTMGEVPKALEDSIMKEMALPDESKMKQIISQWANQQLPLLKNELLKVYQLVKHYDIPSESLVNLSAQKVPVSEQEVQCITQFRSQGQAMMETFISEAFKGMTHDQATECTKALNQYVHTQTEQLKSFLTQLSIKSDLPASLRYQLTTFLNQDDSQMSHSKSIENWFYTLPKEDLKILAQQLVHKHLAIDPKALLEKSADEDPLREVAEKLKEVTKEIEKFADKEQIKSHVQVFEQTRVTLEKYNMQGQYFCFPLQIKEQEASGAFYFFKPKKNKKGASNDQGMYIVLALDMPALKHIEVHLVENHNQLDLKIKVVNEEILKQMKKHEEQLKSLMVDSVVPIGDIHIQLLSKPMQKEAVTTTRLYNRLDFRV